MKENTDAEAAAIFKKLADEILNPNDTKKLLKTTIQKRLHLFEDDIRRLKEEGLSYNALIELIRVSSTQAGTPLVISTQALRSYCQDFLGIKPKPRPRKKTEDS